MFYNVSLKLFVRLCATVLACLCMVNSGSAATSSQPPMQIIIFHSSITSIDWTELFNLGLNRAFQQSSLGNVKITYEYLNVEESTPSVATAKRLDEAFSQQRFNLVIIADNAAYKYIAESRQDRMDSVPVIFCDLLRNEKPQMQKNKNMTVVQLDLSVIDTMQAAAKMFPSRKKMLIVCDSHSMSAQIARQHVSKELANHKSDMQVEYCSAPTLDELQKLLAELDDSYTALLLCYKQDANGLQYSYKQSASAICRSSRVPVFGLLSGYSNLGIIGGKLANGYELGHFTAEVSLKILSRRLDPAGNYIFEIPNNFEFDWNVMRRFGVSEKQLPFQSKVINKPENPYFKLLLWSIAIFVIAIFQSIIIIAILYARKREKITSQALKSSERQLRSLTENLPDIIFRVDRKGNYSYINQAVERTLSIKAEDMIARTVSRLKMPESSPDSEGNEIIAVFKDGMMRTREDIFPLANGGNLIIESRLVPERDEKGAIENVLCICRDVTSRKMAEKELNMRHYIIENSNSAIMILRANGAVYFSNEAASRLLGFNRGEMRQMHFHHLNFDRNQRNFPSLLQKIKAGQGLHCESSYTQKDGRRVPVELVFSYFSVENEEFVCLFMFDITERKNFEEELRHAKEKAEQSDRLKSTFLANMSHEVRTPLNGILGFAELLKYSSPDQEEQQKFIDIIYDSGNTLLQIINDILDISKI